MANVSIYNYAGQQVNKDVRPYHLSFFQTLFKFLYNNAVHDETEVSDCHFHYFFTHSEEGLWDTSIPI